MLLRPGDVVKQIVDCPDHPGQKCVDVIRNNETVRIQLFNEREERLHELLHEITGMFYSFSLRDGALYWSSVVTQVLGFTEEMRRSDPFLWRRSIHPDDAPNVDEAIEVLRHGDVFDITYRIRNINGEYIWLRDRSIGRSVTDGDFIVEGVAFDVTAEHFFRSSYHSTHSLLESTLESVADGVLAANLYGEITHYNKKFFDVLDFSLGDVTNVSELFGLLSENCTDENCDLCSNNVFGEYATTDATLEAEATYRDRRISMRTQPQRLEGSIIGRVWSVRDVTDAYEAKQKLHQLAFTDPVTGLSNRADMQVKLSAIIKNASEKSLSIALLIIDIDNFKRVNDTLSHRVGDEVLQHFAARLKTSIRNYDLLARSGGDEFIIVLGQDHLDNLYAELNTLVEQLAEPFIVDGKTLYLTVSIGCAVFPADSTSVSGLFQSADAAMYRAKESGKNTWSFFSADLSDKMKKDLNIENGLRKALAEGAFQIHFQPQYDLRSGSLVGAEALLRWNTNRLQGFSVEEAIHVAESTGLIEDIGHIALLRTCELISILKRRGIRVPVYANVSGRQFQQAGFFRTLRKYIEDHCTEPSMLGIEITETFLMQEPQSAIEMMSELRKIGVSIAIDDFGTGYSSLAYLKKLPISEVKIDRSFIKDLPHDTNDVAIAKAIIAMTTSLGMTVLAEGLETLQQRDFLIKHGCYLGQGYLCSHPVNLETFLEIVDEQNIHTVGCVQGDGTDTDGL